MGNTRISVTLTSGEIDNLMELATAWRCSMSAAAGRCIAQAMDQLLAQTAEEEKTDDGERITHPVQSAS